MGEPPERTDMSFLRGRENNVGIQFTETKALGRMDVKICDVFITALPSQFLKQSIALRSILIATTAYRVRTSAINFHIS
jgi:hypothetical protein